MNPTFEQAIEKVDWEQLEKQHRIVITGNTASVFARRWLFGDKLLFTAVAFLVTKAVDIQMWPQNDRRSSVFEFDVTEILTELNAASELQEACMIFLGELSATRKSVDEEETETDGA